MFRIDEDMTIHVTRGDEMFFTVTAEENGVKYKFKPDDILRIKVMKKKNCSEVAFQKDFLIEKETGRVDILLTEEETKIGDVISKPLDYWYEIELNPYTVPQTIIGYDEDGPKIFKLYPEGRDLGNPVVEEVSAIDSELSMTSRNPVENQAVTRAMNELINEVREVLDDIHSLPEDFEQRFDILYNNYSNEINELATTISGDLDSHVEQIGNTLSDNLDSEFSNYTGEVNERFSELKAEVEDNLIIMQTTGNSVTINPSYSGVAEVSGASGASYPVTVTSTNGTQTDSVQITSATDKKYVKTYAGTTTITATSNVKIKYGSAESGAELLSDLKTTKEVAETFVFATNVSVPTSAWASDSTYADFGYKANISVAGVTEDHFADVILSQADVLTANYAPFTTTGAGTVSIYAKAIPASAITVLTIRCTKGVI